MSSDPDDSDLFDDESYDTSEDLIFCPECRAEIYAETERCPECGHWIVQGEQRRMTRAPKESRALKIVAIVLLLLLLGITLFAVVIAVISGIASGS